MTSNVLPLHLAPSQANSRQNSNVDSFLTDLQNILKILYLEDALIEIGLTFLQNLVRVRGGAITPYSPDSDGSGESQETMMICLDAMCLQTVIQRSICGPRGAT